MCGRESRISRLFQSQKSHDSAHFSAHSWKVPRTHKVTRFWWLESSESHDFVGLWVEWYDFEIVRQSHEILMTWDADDSAHFRRVPSPNDLRSHLILMTWDAYDSAHFRRVPSPNDLRSHLILDPGIEVIWFPWFYSTQMSSWHLHNSFMTWLTRLRWVRDIYITRDSKSLSRESKKSFDSRLRNRESRIWNHRSLLQKRPMILSILLTKATP